MNTIKKDNRVILVLEIARRENNYLDDDVLQDAIKDLEEAKNDQNKYEAIHYVSACLEYRGKNKSALQVKQYAMEFSDEMSLSEHMSNKNGEAIIRFENKVAAGETVRIL